MRHQSAKDSGRSQVSSCFKTDGRITTVREDLIWPIRVHLSLGQSFAYPLTHFKTTTSMCRRTLKLIIKHERHLNKHAGKSAIKNEPMRVNKKLFLNAMSKKIRLLIASTCAWSQIASKDLRVVNWGSSPFTTKYSPHI